LLGSSGSGLLARSSGLDSTWEKKRGRSLKKRKNNQKKKKEIQWTDRYPAWYGMA
jgi:hypothetical protein